MNDGYCREVPLTPTSIARLLLSRSFLGLTHLHTSHTFSPQFNITFMDMQCQFMEVDVFDVLGTNKVDIKSNVEKWR